MKTQVPTQKQQAQHSENTKGSSPLQGNSPFVDARESSSAQRKLANLAINSPQTIQQKTSARQFQHSLNISTQLQQQKNITEHTLQQKQDSLSHATLGNSPFEKSNPTQQVEESKPNNTGLPNQLKSGIESLSGMSMDHVKVHYNSAQPAQLNALAYAQGSDIHVAPGQEQHLPHEAWHVVQQAQGRVKPTMQMKAGMPINDDASLEREADVMGARAATHQPHETTSAATKVSLGTTPAQRKILINEAEKNEVQVYDHLTTKSVAVKDAFISEIKSKPKKVQDLAEDNNAYASDFGTAEKDKTQIAAWNSEPQNYKYTDTSKDAETIAKDTVKYYLYKKFKWLNIGVAAYMTGDVTGLLMATSLQDTVSLEILKGKKDKGEKDKTWTPPENYSQASKDIYGTSDTEILGVPANELMVHVREDMDKRTGKKVTTPNFYVPGAIEGSTKLPDTFSNPNLSSKLIETDVEDDPELGGTRDAYKKKFDGYTDPKPKPWDKETYEATDMIGKMYPKKKEQIREMLLPEKGEEETLNKIETYRSQKFANKNIILMWGRLSGLAGGAHTELDSHPITMVQIAQKISKDFPSRSIVLIGDKVVSESILRKAGVTSEVIDINAFWKDEYFSKNNIPISDRRYQHYLVKTMSDKNDAVSIGMRSGSLEATALLGVKTIFLDDKGNNAEERMEFWAGGAANGRAEAMKDPNWQQRERAHKGPVENYKRVATSRQTGDKIHAGGDIEKTLESLQNIKTEFDKGTKKDENAAVSAPQTQARIKKTTDKLPGISDIKTLSTDLSSIYASVISKTTISTGKNLTETVKLPSATFALIKTESEKKLKNIGNFGVGLTENELSQISGLTRYMTLGADDLENLAPKDMHNQWSSLGDTQKTSIKSKVYADKESYPNILRHIFHFKAPTGLGGYSNR